MKTNQEILSIAVFTCYGDGVHQYYEWEAYLDEYGGEFIECDCGHAIDCSHYEGVKIKDIPQNFLDWLHRDDTKREWTMKCANCQKSVSQDEYCLNEHNRPICPECDQELYGDDGLRTCPHCGQGEINIKLGEKYCYACSHALAVYGELP